MIPFALEQIRKDPLLQLGDYTPSLPYMAHSDLIHGCAKFCDVSFDLNDLGSGKVDPFAIGEKLAQRARDRVHQEVLEYLWRYSAHPVSLDRLVRVSRLSRVSLGSPETFTALSRDPQWRPQKALPLEGMGYGKLLQISQGPYATFAYSVRLDITFVPDDLSDVHKWAALAEMCIYISSPNFMGVSTVHRNSVWDR
tara:strand:+ start:1747 stop:2334 length:588 start_codon:yes stop_codon:yes gene_type:complete